MPYVIKQTATGLQNDAFAVHLTRNDKIITAGVQRVDTTDFSLALVQFT